MYNVVKCRQYSHNHILDPVWCTDCWFWMTWAFLNLVCLAEEAHEVMKKTDTSIIMGGLRHASLPRCLAPQAPNPSVTFTSASVSPGGTNLINSSIQRAAEINYKYKSLCQICAQQPMHTEAAKGM